ncbi:S-adenosyl-L-methionine-dependent methyltransferase [Phytophthora cactorum]|nr:S-adenosyl-L-methionine-dependent methyltransferase [Phytophthora cactorum]
METNQRQSLWQEEMPEMKWIEADMTKLREVFTPESFDVVIDKAAMDALMCDEGDRYYVRAGATGNLRADLVRAATLPQALPTGEGEQAPTSTVYGWEYSYHNIGALTYLLLFEMAY